MPSRGADAVERDARLMRLALALAARARGRTSPNPLVGALLVDGDEVVGRGYHRRVGSPHAEVEALRRAGARARGAELFVNLEPCCHHGRTPPCVEAIVAAGVRRVVVGMIDPHPLVHGRGLRALRRAGLEVRCGVLAEDCEALNRAFVKRVSSGRPLVTLKTAMTLDGRVAARSGDARWITGPVARAAAHRLRDAQDAVMVGVGTVLRDDPLLNVRGLRGGRDPLRVVVDSRLRTPPSAALVQLTRRSSAATWIVTTRAGAADAERVRALERAGASVIVVASQRGRVKLAALLALLAERGCCSLLVEGGPTLAGALWRQRLVDELVCFVAPKLLGDAEALPLLLGVGPVARVAQAVELERLRMRRLGVDLEISGRVAWPAG
ncbi:MAG: bifunctional diaminohydroxyphosphoribosylaminopyrimidine deaminase/5-amino-6-(5-phosphoribosylamino)uracil reductase RibD [Proteobacteria bacterium]|nr:bifunctional diaminohydroxyphosphoribosylaminopyrimidine deaminase/5-amino-6-(5-phosphoribosylamino)uracil reductase RibD [Pseudomonadota bacterium]